MTAFSAAQTVLQAMSRAVYALSRDHGRVHWHVILDVTFYLDYPNSSSRWRLLRKDLKYYPHSSSRCLVIDHCQYSSCVARSCQPSCCQCYFLGRNYGAGFGLYYSHLLQKGIPPSPGSDVQTWPVLHGWWMVGFGMQFYMHIMDALYLRRLGDTHQSPSNGTKYELCLCKFSVCLLPEKFAYYFPFFKVIIVGVIVFA